ncbi:MAG: DUF4398 domain-containing protein [Epsilonproteobacteria bacterium]|nr:DUF4398 domain-containing protein [Campylobacterota bacterium]
MNDRVLHLFFVLIIAVLALNGCASKQPPLEDISNAKIALLKAKDAEAGVLSPNTFALAKKQFSVSKTHMDKEEYEEAKYAAQKAYMSAKLATQKAKNAKVQKQVDQLNDEVNSIKQEFTTIVD